MTPEPPIGGVAQALAALVSSDLDVADVLSRLLVDCAQATGADAVAILAVEGNGDLAMLAATSHSAVQIELLQAQRHAGPCVESIETMSVITGDERDLAERWGEVGRDIADAGITRVAALPMVWRGQALGCVNLFWRGAGGEVDADVGLLYADLATVVVVQSAPMTPDVIHAALHDALTARAVVEQAKGVLAYAHDVDMERAYALLLQRVAETATPLTRVAEDVVRRRGRPSS